MTDIDLDAIRQRRDRVRRDCTEVNAILSSMDVPALLREVERLLDQVQDLQASLEDREREDTFRVVYSDGEDPYLECDMCGDVATIVERGDTLGALHARAHEHRERDHQPDRNVSTHATNAKDSSTTPMGGSWPHNG